MEPPSSLTDDYYPVGMALGLILVLYVILKAGEIYLLTISKTESDQISKRKVSAADSLFNSIYQLSAFFVTAISVLVFVIFGNGILLFPLIKFSVSFVSDFESVNNIAPLFIDATDADDNASG